MLNKPARLTPNHVVTSLAHLHLTLMIKLSLLSLVLFNFYQKPVASLIKNSSATEDHEEKSPELKKRDNIATPTVEPTFKTTTINFPVNSYMANVMLQLFGKEGILEKGGFYRTGYIHENATASIVLLESFQNRSVLLHEIMQAHEAPIGAGSLALVVQLFFTPTDFRRVTDWLREDIRLGYINYDDPCSPIVKIKFVCCTKIANPFLAPKFGTLRVDID